MSTSASKLPLPSNRELLNALGEVNINNTPVEHLSEWLKNPSLMQRFERGLKYTGLSNAQSIAAIDKLATSTQIKAFIKCMSGAFNADELIIFQLLEQYLKDEPDHQIDWLTTAQLEKFERFYFADRLDFLSSLQLLLQISDVSNVNLHPYHEPCKEFATSLLEKKLLDELIEDYKNLHDEDFKKIPQELFLNAGIAENENEIRIFCDKYQENVMSQRVFEQEILLENILAIIFTNPIDATLVLRLIKLFDSFNFGVSRTQAAFSPLAPEAVQLAVCRIEYLHVVVILAALQLDRLLGARRADITLDEHSLFASCPAVGGNPVEAAQDAIRPINDYITGTILQNCKIRGERRDKPHGVLLMAWASFIRVMHDISPGFLLSAQAIDELATQANEAGAMTLILRLNNDILSMSDLSHFTGFNINSPCWHDTAGSDEVSYPITTPSCEGRNSLSSTKTIRYVLKEFMSALIAAFGDNLTSPASIGVLAKASSTIIYGEPGLARTFFSDKNPISTLLKLSENLFPEHRSQYLQLICALASDSALADVVFERMSNLTGYSKAIRRENVELQSQGNSTLATACCDICCYDDGVVILKGSTGVVLGEVHDELVVRWNVIYSGWDVMLLRLEAVRDELEQSDLDTKKLQEAILFVILCGTLSKLHPPVVDRLTRCTKELRLKHWLLRKGLLHLYPRLIKHGVSLQDLHRLSLHAFDQLGIHDPSTRQKLLQSVDFDSRWTISNLFYSILESADQAVQNCNTSSTEKQVDLVRLCSASLGALSSWASAGHDRAGEIWRILMEARSSDSKLAETHIIQISKRVLRTSELSDGCYYATLSMIQIVANMLQFLVHHYDTTIQVLIDHLFPTRDALNLSEFLTRTESLGLCLSKEAGALLLRYCSSPTGKLDRQMFLQIVDTQDTLLLSLEKAIPRAILAELKQFLSKFCPKSTTNENHRHLLSQLVNYVMDILSQQTGWRYAQREFRWWISTACLKVLRNVLTKRGYGLAAERLLVEVRRSTMQSLLHNTALQMVLVSSTSMLMNFSLLSCDRDIGCGDVPRERPHSIRDLIKRRNDLAPVAERTEFCTAGAGFKRTRLVSSYFEYFLIEQMICESLRLIQCLLEAHCYLSTELNIPNLTAALLSLPTQEGSKQPFLTVIAAYLSYPESGSTDIRLLAAQVLLASIYCIDGRDESTMDDNTANSSILSLFPSISEAVALRELVTIPLYDSRSSNRLRTTLIELVTSALEFQPGLAAMLLCSDLNVADGVSPILDYVVGVLGSISDENKSSSPILVGAVLKLILALWEGAAYGRQQHTLSTEYIRRTTKFWSNLVALLDIEIPDDASAELKAYRTVSRSYILRVLAIEWHNGPCSETCDILKDLGVVFEAYRRENSYPKWLVQCQQLSFDPRFIEQLATTSKNCGIGLKMLRTTSPCIRRESIGRQTIAQCLPSYGDTFVFDVDKVVFKRFPQDDDVAQLHREFQHALRTANEMWSLADAELQLMESWKVFLEICCLQTRSASTNDPSKLQFIDDPTSLDVIKRIGNSLANEARTGIAIATGYMFLSEIFLSMLHHQIFSVVRKAVDPVKSQTRIRTTGLLGVSEAIEMLKLVDRACSTVQNLVASFSDDTGHLIGVYKFEAHELQVFALRLRIPLMTSTLLLLRHIESQSGVLFRDAVGDTGLCLRLVNHITSWLEYCNTDISSASSQEWCVAVRNRAFHLCTALLPQLLGVETPLVNPRTIFKSVFVQLSRDPTVICAALQLITSMSVSISFGEMFHENDVLGDLIKQPSFGQFSVELKTIEKGSYRGYRGQEESLERCPDHKNWCSVLQVIANVSRLAYRCSMDEPQKGNAIIHRVLEHIGSIKYVLELSLQPSIISIAALSEANTVLGILLGLAEFSDDWRCSMPDGYVRLLEAVRCYMRDFMTILGDGESCTSIKLSDIAVAISPDEYQGNDSGILSEFPKCHDGECDSQVGWMLRHAKVVHLDKGFRSVVAPAVLATMENLIVETLLKATMIMIKVTPRLNPTVNIDGTVYSDPAAALPILEYIPQSAATATAAPSLGHISKCVMYCANRLIHADDDLLMSLKEKWTRLMEQCLVLLISNFELHQSRYIHNENDRLEMIDTFREILDLNRKAAGRAQHDDVAFFETLLDQMKKYCAAP